MRTAWKNSSAALLVAVFLVLASGAGVVTAAPPMPDATLTLRPDDMPVHATFSAGDVVHVLGDLTLEGSLTVLPVLGEDAFRLVVDGRLVINGVVDATARLAWQDGPAAPAGTSLRFEAEEIVISPGAQLLAGDGGTGRTALAEGTAWKAVGQHGGAGGSIEFVASHVEVLGTVLPGDGGAGGGAFGYLGSDAVGGDGGQVGLATATVEGITRILASGNGGDGGDAIARGDPFGWTVLCDPSGYCFAGACVSVGCPEGETFCLGLGMAPPLCSSDLAPRAKAPEIDIDPFEDPGKDPGPVPVPPWLYEILQSVLRDVRAPSHQEIIRDVKDTIPVIPPIQSPWKPGEPIPLPPLPPLPGLPPVPPIPPVPPLCTTCIPPIPPLPTPCTSCPPPQHIPCLDAPCGPEPQTICIHPHPSMTPLCFTTDPEAIPLPPVDLPGGGIPSVEGYLLPMGGNDLTVAAPCGGAANGGPGRTGWGQNGEAGGAAVSRGCPGANGRDGDDGVSVPAGAPVFCTPGGPGSDGAPGHPGGEARGGDGGNAVVTNEALIHPGRGGDATSIGGKGGNGGTGGDGGNSLLFVCPGGNGGNGGHGGDAATAVGGDGGRLYGVRFVLPECGGGGTALSEGGYGGTGGAGGEPGGKDGTTAADGIRGSTTHGHRCPGNDIV